MPKRRNSERSRRLKSEKRAIEYKIQGVQQQKTSNEGVKERTPITTRDTDSPGVIPESPEEEFILELHGREF